MRTSWVIPPSDNPEEEAKVIASDHKVMEKILKESNDKALAVLNIEQQKKNQIMSLRRIRGHYFGSVDGNQGQNQKIK